MSDFGHSIAANNVLNRFYNVDKMVYVEGQDDVLFWGLVFEKIAGYEVEVEAVGGKCELKKLVESIFFGDSEYLVAMDSDFDLFKNVESHPSILKTPGYSIENTLVTSESLAISIRNLGRVSTKNVPWEQCREWLSGVGEVVKRLAVLDVVNELDCKGLRLGLDNSDRFMVSRKSCEFCSIKITEFMRDLSVEVSEESASYVDSVVCSLGLSYLDVIRGHFLFSASLRFVNKKVKDMGINISISRDSIYSNMIAVFESSFSEKHPHFSHYKESIESI